MRVCFAVEGIRHTVKQHIKQECANAIHIGVFPDPLIISALQFQRGKAPGIGNLVSEFCDVCNRDNRIEVKELDELCCPLQCQNIARLYVKVKVPFVVYFADCVGHAFHGGNAVLDRRVSPVGQFLPLRVGGDNIQGVVCLKNIIGVRGQIRQAVRREKIIAKLVGPPQFLLTLRK